MTPVIKIAPMLQLDCRCFTWTDVSELERMTWHFVLVVKVLWNIVLGKVLSDDAADGVVTKYWYHSPLVSCADAEIFQTEELGKRVGQSAKLGLCVPSEDGYSANMFCTDTLPTSMKGPTVQLYQDAQCQEVYYSKTYKKDACFEYTNSIVVKAQCRPDGACANP